jgi:hypothetical protein
MKMRKKHLPCFGVAALMAVSTASAQVVEQWDFDNGNLAATAGGQDLQYSDDAAQAATSFGTTTSFGIPDISGSAAKVAKFQGFTLPSAVGLPVPASGNGSGSLLNEWTIVMDLLYPGTSDKKSRALLETDGGLTPDADLFINEADGIGISQIYSGNVTPNVWHRIAFVIDNDNNKIRKYIDGQFVGSQAADGDDGRWALNPGTTAALFADDSGEIAPVYVNSIQLRDSALTTGQIAALGIPSATGIPQTIPPIPAVLDSTTPEAGAVNVDVQPSIEAVLTSGDSTIAPASVAMLFDNLPVTATITPGTGSFTMDYTLPSVLDPNSLHNVGIVFSENGTLKTNFFSFTVLNYQKVKLPAPLYLETFDNVDEGSLPAGWSVTNHTDVVTPGFDLDDLHSDTYLDWVVVSADRLNTLKSRIFKQPPISLNGTFIDNLGTGNMLYAESDSRDGNQVQVAFTQDYDLSGKSNIFVAFNSLYEQNQDNINALEYSIDQGQTWLPLLYMVTEFNDTSDVFTNADGSIDAVKTMNTVHGDAAYGLSYGAFIGAPITQDLAPFISGRYNDEADLPAAQNYSKRIEVLRAIKADGQAKVRFRFLQAGTGSWYWGVDNFGIYQINTPVITAAPQPLTVSYGDNATFNVTAAGAGALSYQWLSNGIPILNATNSSLALNSVTDAAAADYSVTVQNSDGPTTSAPAHLTVIVAPDITSQPASILTSAGKPLALNVSVRGRAPFNYQWQKDGVNISGATSSSFNIASGTPADSGTYQVVITNSAGTATSSTVGVLVLDAPITQDLVVHLKFDGDPSDTSGRGNDATLQGNPTFQPGILGQALKITTLKDGSEFDYATLGYPEDLKFHDTNDFSVSFWVNYTDGVDDPPFISNKNWGSSGNVGWGVFSQNGGNFRMNVTGSGGKNISTSSTPNVRDGKWHNILVTFWHGVAVLVFADGQLVQTTGETTGTVDTDDIGYAVNIGQDGTGAYTDSGSAQMTALIDDVGIWRRAVTPQEAASIYAQGLLAKDLTTASGANGGGPGGDVTITDVQKSGANLTFKVSGTGSFQLQTKASLSDAAWTNVGSAVSTGTFSVPASGQTGFFRVVKQ